MAYVAKHEKTAGNVCCDIGKKRVKWRMLLWSIKLCRKSSLFSLVSLALLSVPLSDDFLNLDEICNSYAYIRTLGPLYQSNSCSLLLCHEKLFLRWWDFPKWNEVCQKTLNFYISTCQSKPVALIQHIFVCNFVAPC